MEELTSTAKIGLSMLILASVIITSFCVYIVVSTFSRDYLEEQTRVVDYTEYEFNDLIGTYLPVLAIDNAITRSSYRDAKNLLCTYTEYVFSNGDATKNKPNKVEKVKWSDFVKAYVDSTVCLTQIEGVPGADTIIFHVKVGG